MLALTKLDDEALAAFPWFGGYRAMSPAAIESEMAWLQETVPGMLTRDRDVRLSLLRREWCLRAGMGILLDGPRTRLIGKDVGFN